MTEKPFERHINFHGAFNFRDLGNYLVKDTYRIRSRWIFRSDELHHMTEADLAYFYDNLGIRTIVDLRQPKSIEQGKVIPLETYPVQFFNVPVPITPDRVYGDGNHSRSLADGYLMCLQQDDVQESILEALNTIGEATSKPVVFHCSLGKDRTGVIGALLLGILGVSDADIITDYTLSEGFAMKVVSRASRDPKIAKWASTAPPQLFKASSKTMQQVLLDLNNQYGSVRNFILSIGGDDSLFHQLEKNLLEKTQ